MYDTREEACQKLEASTVLFDGRPVYVIGAYGSKGKVQLQFVTLPSNSNDVRSEFIKDPRWDFRSLPSRIGYVNVNSPFDSGVTEAVFSYRIPNRSSRQGLDNRTAAVEQHCVDKRQNWNWDFLRNTEGLFDTVSGKFPTAKEAVNLLTFDPTKVRSVAVSRRYCMIFDKVNPPNLVYRGEKIGYTETGDLFRIAPHKAHLKEELTDMMGFNCV